MTWYHYCLIWGLWGKVGLERRAVLLLDFILRQTLCSRSSPRQRNQEFSIRDLVAGGSPVLPWLLYSLLWMETLQANTVVTKWWLVQSTEVDFLSVNPCGLVFIVFPQSSGFSKIQKPQIYPVHTMIPKLHELYCWGYWIPQGQEKFGSKSQKLYISNVVLYILNI